MAGPSCVPVVQQYVESDSDVELEEEEEDGGRGGGRGGPEGGSNKVRGGPDEVGGGPDEDRVGQDGAGREEVGAVGRSAGQQTVRCGVRSQQYSWKNSLRKQVSKHTDEFSDTVLLDLRDIIMLKCQSPDLS